MSDRSPAVPAFLDFLPEGLRARLDADAVPVPEEPGLRVAPGLRERFPQLETIEALSLVCEVYRATREALSAVLEQRKIDRLFIDTETRRCVARNRGVPFDSTDYATVLGQRDVQGRVVIGFSGAPVSPQTVDVPGFMQGAQVTYFGPPDTEANCESALSALSRRRPDEPALVSELVAASTAGLRWGADAEDSLTPRPELFLRANQNLQACLDAWHPDGGRALPIKRIPGLALPDGAHLLEGQPLPLHLYDYVTHLWRNRGRSEALVFYVPKLENEEEAAYLRHLIDATEAAVSARDPDFRPGSTRILVVFENPRALFRVAEMAAALGPHFLGGSLGWHDFIASTARLFRNDGEYRIPVKADPEIVIRRIKESHLMLARTLGPMGALCIGGMYGVLFDAGSDESHRACLAGFIRDVATQLRRGLQGFWVAHPDFVRVGVALCEAWRRGRGPVDDLVRALLPDAAEHLPVLAFLDAPDAPGLDATDPRYPRALLAADLNVSRVIANDDPIEVRYNVFQALQYLAAWLSGEACVALPASIRDAWGQNVSIRVLDDLATTERSRWELWAEVHHGRVSRAAFESVLAEELAFIRSATSESDRRVEVRWAGEAARFYPVAGKLLQHLVTTHHPPEFVTQLCLAFTLAPVRDAADPWQAALDFGVLPCQGIRSGEGIVFQTA